MSISTVEKLVTRIRNFIQSLINAKNSIIRLFRAFKAIALWVFRLPNAVATAISRWINTTGQAITNVGHAIKIFIGLFLKWIAIGAFTIWSLALLVCSLLWMWRRYRIYRHEKDLRIQAELDAQRLRRETEQRARLIKDAATKRAKEKESRRRQEYIQQQQELRRQEDLKQRETWEKLQRAEHEQKLYRQWLGQSEVLLSSRETMTRFPEFPFWPCSYGCPGSGALQACQHTLKRLFQASGTPYRGLLEKEKLRWHPDKFERCPESCRKRFKEKATEIFKIIQTLREEP
jgi:hypothetical protein